MSEELIQRKLLEKPYKIGNWNFYNIGSTNLNALKNNNIIKDIDYGELGKRKPDGIIVSNNKEIIAIIENKNPEKFNTPELKKKAIEEALELTKPLKVKIAIATDGTDTIWINGLNGEYITDKEGNKIISKFDYENKKVENLIIEIYKAIDEKNSKIIEPETQDPTKLASEIWQDIWAVSGATAENCLYTFVELFIFKYISDLGILGNLYSFDYLYKMYEYETPSEVLAYYADRIRLKLKELFPADNSPTGDGTTIINGTIFVSRENEAIKSYSGVFKKILKRFNDFGKLENIDLDFKSKVFESFLKESISKKNWGQFFTPLNIVNPMIKMVDIREDMIICDPASGVGKFLLQAVHSEIDRFYEVSDDGKIIRHITLEGFDKGFDQEEQRTIILAKANMLIYFSEFIKEYIDVAPNFTEEFADLLNDTFKLKTDSILGTLKDPVENKYDLILTNPPYVTSGSKNLRDEIKKDTRLSNYYKDSGMGIEGLFMRWIINALKKGGKALVVIPDGLLNRATDTNLREKLIEECEIDLLISLPINTFYTTNKKTYILGITKKRDKSKIQTDPVFTYLVSEIGETLDINRFPCGENQLETAANLFNQFKGSKKSFKTDDPRCKILDIEYFIENSNKHWLIDRCWTDEEKIKLGIKEKEEEMTLFELSLYVEEIANDLMEFKNELIDIEDDKKKIEYKEVSINKLFHPVRGNSKYTKKFGEDNSGDYPVFSATRSGPLTYIDKYDYSGRYLTWSINGFAGYMDIIEGQFSINGDRGILKLKDGVNNISIDYVKYILEPKLRKLAKGRKGEDGKNEYTKVYASTLEDDKLTIKIPIDKNGDYSLEGQNYILNRYQILEDYKGNIERHINLLENINYSKDTFLDINHQEYSVLEIFEEPVKGKSKYTRKYILENAGEYPLYSSQTSNEGILGYINTYDHNGEALTWTTDGIYAGTSFYRNGKFSMTTHCGALFVKEEYADIINLEYVNAYMRSFLKEYAVGEGNKRVTATNMKNDVKILIPVDKKGDIDINMQSKIVEEYTNWEKIRKNTIEKLTELKNISVINL